MNTDVFPEEFLQLLQRGGLMPMASRQSTLGGRFCRKDMAGDSQDFFDFRPYAPGDDCRFVDWNVFNRCRKLFVKKYHATPRDAHVISLDGSQSIRCSRCRELTAWRTAAWLAGKLLRCGENVEIRVGQSEHRFSGTSCTVLTLVCEFLSDAYRQSPQNSLVDYGLRTSKKHWIISDFYAGEDLPTWARMIGGRAFIPLRIYEDWEENPDWLGDCCLCDAETGQQVTVTLDETALQTYRQDLRYFEEVLNSVGMRCGIPLLKIEACKDFKKLLEQLERSLGRMR